MTEGAAPVWREGVAEGPGVRPGGQDQEATGGRERRRQLQAGEEGARGNVNSVDLIPLNEWETNTQQTNQSIIQAVENKLIT